METICSIQSLDRAFDIVEALSNHGNQLSLAELHLYTGLNKATIHRMLSSLKSRGYVVQTVSGNYRLTFKFCSLSQKIINSVSLLPLVLPHLKQLSKSVQELVHFVIQDDLNTVYLDREEPANSLYRSINNVGIRRPLHTTAGGKSILASMRPEQWLTYWESAEKTPVTPYTITSYEKLRAELEVAQRLHYAIEAEENTLGFCCIGVSIYDRYNNDRYAISLSGMRDTMTQEHISQLLPILFQTRDRIQSDIGY